MYHLKIIIVSALFTLFATGAVFTSGVLAAPVAYAATATAHVAATATHAVVADECGITQTDVAHITAVKTIRRWRMWMR